MTSMYQQNIYPSFPHISGGFTNVPHFWSHPQFRTLRVWLTSQFTDGGPWKVRQGLDVFVGNFNSAIKDRETGIIPSRYT